MADLHQLKYKKDTLKSLKATRIAKKLTDHIISNISANKILHSNVLPCPRISDHEASSIIANMPVNKFETRYKYITNFINFELGKYVQDFKVLPVSLVYSVDDLNDQLDTLNKLVLNAINEYALLIKTNFTRPAAPCIKNFKITKLQKERDH